MLLKLYPKVHRRYTSLPIIGPILDGFGTWLHSTAVHLLRSGVDIVTISQWLGDASVTTTNRYATVDLEMKRRAIEQAGGLDDTATGLASWRADASILTWLEAL